MAARKSKSVVEQRGDKLSSPARRKARSPTPGLIAAESELRGIASRNYRKALRECLSQ